jgi:RNA polymerase sigma-70 factor (ECF subfamily)
MSQARQGNLAAWGELLEAQRGHLSALAEQRLRGRVTVRVEAADVVQQTFLEAHRSLDQFLGEEEAALRAWLERILEHNIDRTFRNHLLLQKRNLRREQSLEGTPADGSAAPRDVDAHHSTPSQRAMRHEDEDRLAQALEKLPQDQRVAVRLRHLHGWRLADIAAELGRTPTATAALVKRGMEALRKQLHASE